MSTWESSEVKKWKELANNVIRNYYQAFQGHKWHEFDLPKEHPLLRAKICFALFGPPTKAIANNNDSEDNIIENAYNCEQHKRADEFIEQIKYLSKTKSIKISFLTVFCKDDKNEFPLPLFSVYAGSSVSKSGHFYVDSQCRTYKNWKDWKENNNLPEMKYAYPKNGYMTCKDGEYAFDINKDPLVEFGEPPSCSTLNKVGKGVDTASGITSLVCGGIGIASIFTPIGPAVLLGTAITGGVSAVWGTSRGIARLVDKGQHGESMTDLESWTLYLGIAALPLHAVTAVANYKIVQGAVQNGRIFTQTIRATVTILNFTTLGVDGTMIALGLANLIEKGKNGQIEPLDVLQFSMSVFFFTNTLIQPKTATNIIKKAQDTHLMEVSKTITDVDAKNTFDRFLNDNKGDGGIKDTSKIIRTVNKIPDADAFFKDHSGASKIKIGGRKGKTVLVSDSNANKTRVNTSRVVKNSTVVQGTIQLPNRDKNKLAKAFKAKNIDDIELNGEKVFQNMTDRQKGRLRKVYGPIKYNQEIIDAAHVIAESMGYDNVDQLMSMTEIISAEAGGKSGADLTNHLNGLKSTGQATFINDLKADIAKASKVANQSKMSFTDPLCAAYHYRKHGQDFPSKMDCATFYFKKVPKQIFQDQYLRETRTFQDGSKQKFYITPNDDFGILMEKPNGSVISSMYNKPGAMEKFSVDMDLANLWNKTHENANRRNLVDALKQGQRIFVSFDGRNPHPLNKDFHGLSEEEIFEMARQFESFQSLEDDGYESE